MTAKTKTAVAVKDESANLPATQMWETEAGAGFENTSGDDFAIPFIKILQKNSPEVDDNDGAFVEGAKPGQFFDTASQETFDALDVIACHYRRAMVIWKPDQGGFVRQEAVGYEAGLPRRKRQDGSETGVFVDAGGNDVVDTRYVFALRVGSDGSTSPVILSFSSTQTKKARNWLTRMQNIKATGDGGRRFTMPMFANVWRLTTVGEQNDKGSWRGYKIDLVGPITDQGLAQAAKDAREMFLSVDTKVRPPATEGEATPSAATQPDDNIPF